MVYLDALVPQDGQSVADLFGPEAATYLVEVARQHGDGWMLPNTRPDLLVCTDHPRKTFLEPVHRQDPQARKEYTPIGSRRPRLPLPIHRVRAPPALARTGHRRWPPSWKGVLLEGCLPGRVSSWKGVFLEAFARTPLFPRLLPHAVLLTPPPKPPLHMQLLQQPRLLPPPRDRLVPRHGDYVRASRSTCRTRARRARTAVVPLRLPASSCDR
jgi:hypothetical protein